MSQMSGPLTNFDDRINPIVIKELRQAVNGRFLAAVLILFLLVSLIVMGLIVMIESNASLEAGRIALLWLQGILVVTCMSRP